MMQTAYPLPAEALLPAGPCVSGSEYQALFDATDEGFCIIQLLFGAAGQPVDGVFLKANPSFERQSGMRDVIGKHMRELPIAGEADHWLRVFEEAHRYVPNERNADGSSVGRILGRIAKEGRKYGVALGLITQRPSDLAEGVLSQCGTIISMRLNNDRDQAFVRAAMPEGARGFLDSIPALRNRECIIVGEGVSTPIRVLFDSLEEGKRPASGDPLFSELWCSAGGEELMLERTIKRWRSQGR